MAAATPALTNGRTRCVCSVRSTKPGQYYHWDESTSIPHGTWKGKPQPPDLVKDHGWLEEWQRSTAAVGQDATVDGVTGELQEGVGHVRTAIEEAFAELFPLEPDEPAPAPPPQPEPEPEPEPEPVAAPAKGGKAKTPSGGKAKTPPGGKGKGKSEPEPVPEPEPELEPEPEPEQQPEPLDEYEQRKQEFDEKRDATHVEMHEVDSYLRQRMKEAREAENRRMLQDDREYTMKHRPAYTGLPVKPSLLQLEEEQLTKYALVDPLDIMQENAQDRLKAQEAPKDMPFMKAEFKLGYMKTVSSVEIRTKLRMAEVPHAFLREPKCAWLALTEEERQAKIEASEARRRHLATHMRKDQLFMERKLMSDMHRRLHFLPNPRFAKEPPVGLRDKHLPSKQNLTSAKHVSFLVTPPEILFSEYSVGGIFQAELQLQNLNMNTRRLRVLPPTTKFFSISNLAFPGRDGYVAPGMIAKIWIRFQPEALGDYEDVLTVHTDMDKFEVPILAARRPPALTLPEVLDCGPVLVGNSRVVEFTCTNLGGHGRFRLVAEEDFVDGIEPLDNLDYLSLTPFSLSPEDFELKSEHTISVKVIFAPTEPGPLRRDFYMLCDNLQTKRFSVVGKGEEVKMPLTHIGARELQGDADRDRPVWLPPMIPGGTSTTTLTVRNDADVPMHFLWKQYVPPPPPPPDADGLPGVAPSPTRVNVRHRPTNKNNQVFFFHPSEGTFAANSVTEFKLEFKPFKVDSYRRKVQLCLDLSDHVMNKDAPPECDFVVMETQLEAMGHSADLRLEPPFVNFSGTVLTNREYREQLVLINDTAVESHFAFERLDAAAQAFEVVPPTGVVPAHSRVVCQVVAYAATEGKRQANLQCRVDHGPVLPLRVDAAFIGPLVGFVEASVDFGMVRRNVVSKAVVTIHNHSDVLAPWRLVQQGEDGGEPAHVITFLPQDAGVLQPLAQQRLEASICPLTDAPLRTNLMAVVEHGRTSFVTARADVVVPKACLSVTEFDLGVTYVDVKIRRTMTLQNLTKMPAAFSFDLALLNAWSPAAMSVDVVPDKGELEPSESIELMVEFWPRQAGVLDGAMVACDVDDMDWPLGFKISTQTMNLDVSYAVLRGMELHRTSGLFPPLDPSAPPTGPTEPPVFLDFGWDNTVREPTTMVLVIRNNTPITTRVALGLDRFGVEDEYGADGTQTLTPRSMGSSALQSPRGSVSFANRLPTGGGASSHAGSSMGGASGRMAMSTKGRRPALDNRNEEMQVHCTRADVVKGEPLAWESASTTDVTVFTRAPGQTVLAERHRQKVRARLLRAGKGLAITLDPPVGKMEPYGEFRCTITAESDMCGDYDDVLSAFVSSDTGELPVKHIPVRVSISGSPLVVQKNRIEASGVLELSHELRVDWRSLVAGAAPATRSFHVHNPGPYDVRVRWTVYNYARQPMTYAGQTDDAEPWVTAGLRVKHGRVRVTLDLFAYEATDANDQQYTVEPAEVVVKAGQPAAFKVAFRSMQPGRFCSFLRGEQMIMHDECEPVTFKMWERLPRGYESSSDEGESDAEEQVAVEAATARVEDGAGAGEGAEEQRAGNASASETGQGEGNAGRHEEGDGEELIGGSDTMPAYRTEDLATMNPDDIGTLTSTGRRRRSGGERGERGPRPQPRYTLGELAAADKDVLLRGCFHPFAAAPRVPMTRLHVNLEALSLRPHLEPDDRKQMTSVLHACNPLSHSQYHRHVTLTNLYATPLTFMLACKRPWKIAAQEPSVPQKPPLIEPLHTPHGFAKQVHTLPPRESVDVHLAFVPAEEYQECDPAEQEDLHFTSNLVAIFEPLGVEQLLPLSADYVYPTLTVAVHKKSTASLSTPNCMEFGLVHVHAPRTMKVVLSNPSLATCYWKVEGDASQHGFTVSPARGTLEGRGQGFAKTQVVEVTFLPPAAQPFARDIEFVCKRGRPCVIRVEGEGTVDEMMETALDRPRAWNCDGNMSRYG